MNGNKNDLINVLNEPAAVYNVSLQILEDEKLLNNQKECLLGDQSANYEKAEMDQLINSLKCSYTERFLTMTRLMKRSLMMKNAKITHQPFTGLKQDS